jgi:Biotin carboxyl carrier protein
MDENLIRKYAALMRELELGALEISENGCTIRLEQSAAPTADIGKAAPRAVERTAKIDTVLAVSEAPIKSDAPKSALTEITSPMIGVFYSSPAEDSEPFVAPGKAVKRGDVLCIIEAMKLMNEITAESDGVIAEVCAEDGQTVDFGRVLFRMKGAGS